jgi:hypothetical protein
MDCTASTTVRDSVLGLLRSFGINTIFGNPGSTELPMFRSFPNDFRYIVGLHESVAVGMADGYAQATRNAAVVNLHSAVGVGHAMGSIFTAYRNRTPLVITAGQQARSILPTEPFLFSMQASELPKRRARNGGPRIARGRGSTRHRQGREGRARSCRRCRRRAVGAICARTPRSRSRAAAR